MSNPSVEDLRDDLESLIAELIEKYNPRSIIVAGSVAKSKFVRGLSDIDLLVITNEAPSKDDRFALTAIKDVDVEVTVYSLEEVVENIKAENPFIVDAVEQGFEVYGDVITTLRQMLRDIRKN
jgi:predicted nucleotidyltransferase